MKHFNIMNFNNTLAVEIINIRMLIYVDVFKIETFQVICQSLHIIQILVNFRIRVTLINLIFSIFDLLKETIYFILYDNKNKLITFLPICS